MSGKILSYFDFIYSLFDRLLFYKKDYKNKSNAKISEQVELEIANGDDKWLICVVCENRITQKSNKITINSSHKHSFTNPHGILYSICCFKSVAGCTTIGLPTTEFTWFAGYSWQVMICSRCKSHNGWRFEKGDNIFYALIEEMIKEES